MMSLRQTPSSGTAPARRRRQDVSEEEREEIRECFALFDADGDGALEYRYEGMRVVDEHARLTVECGIESCSW